MSTSHLTANPGLADATVIRQAARRSMNFVRTGRILPDDEADYRQELILDVLQNGHHFDSNRGSWPTFVSGLMRNRSETLAQTEARRRSIERSADFGEADELDLRDTRRAAFVDPATQRSVDLRTEINLALSRLPADLRSLAEQLRWMNLDEIAAQRGVSKQWIHLLKRRIRRAFIAAGVMPHGWDPTTDHRKKRSTWS